MTTVKRKSLILSLLVLMSVYLYACSAPLATLSADEIYRLIRDDTTVQVSDRNFNDNKEELPCVEEWYGEWRLSDATGQWAEFDSYSWDCCARLSADGYTVLTVWDEDMSEDYYLARFILNCDGEVSCTGGDFLEVGIIPGEVNITFSDDAGFYLNGSYRKAGEGGFSYSIYLRPWGDSWENETQLPRHYSDWYLPLIDQGGAMPSHIN